MTIFSHEPGSAIYPPVLLHLLQKQTSGGLLLKHVLWKEYPVTQSSVQWHGLIIFSSATGLLTEVVLPSLCWLYLTDANM